MDIIYLLVGWALGISGTLLVGEIKSRQDRRAFLAALSVELSEFKAGLVSNAFMISMRSGKLDKERVEWATRELRHYRGDKNVEGLAQTLDALTRLEQTSIAAMTEHSKRNATSDHRFRRVSLPFLDANLSIVKSLDAEACRKILSIRSHSRMLDEMIVESKEYHLQTFDSSLTDTNREIVGKNLDGAYRWIELKCMRLCSLIDELFHCMEQDSKNRNISEEWKKVDGKQSTQTGASDSQTQDERMALLEQRKTGYGTATHFAGLESHIAWRSFQSLLTANTLLMVLIGGVIKYLPELGWLIIALPFAGILLCAAWLFICIRSDRYTDYWFEWARDFEQKIMAPEAQIITQAKLFSEGNTYEIGEGGEPRRIGWWTSKLKARFLMRAVILMFSVIYLGLLLSTGLPTLELLLWCLRIWIAL